MTAVLSPCGIYRYRLERTVGMVGPVFAFFGINPSTADATEDDPTVRKWTGFTKAWGGSRFVVGNAWPLRATDVRALATATRWKHIDRENWSHLLRMVEEADVLVPCWGDRGKVPKSMHAELDRLRCWLVTVGQATGKPVQCFGLTKAGDPMHPLMLPYSTRLQALGPFASVPA